MPGAGSAPCPVAATRNPGPSPGWRPGRPGAVPVGTLTLAALLAWTPCGGTDIVDETRARATHEVPGLKQVGEAINRVQAEVERGAKAIAAKARGGTTTPPPPAAGRAAASGAGAAGGPVKPIAPTQPTADRDTASANKGPAGKEDARRPKTKGRPEKSPPGAALPAKPPAKGAKAGAKTPGSSAGPASAAPVAPQDGRAPPTAAPPAPSTTDGPAAPIPALAPAAAGVAAAATAAASDPHPPPPGPTQGGDAAPLAAPGAAPEPATATEPRLHDAMVDGLATPVPVATDVRPQPPAEGEAGPGVSAPDPGPALPPEPAPEAGRVPDPGPTPVPEAPVSDREPAPPPPLTGLVFRDCDDCPEYVPILGTDGEPGGAPSSVSPGANRPGASLAAFGMTRYEITFAQYDRFCKEKAWPCPGDQGWGRGERPAINLTHDDAVLYAAWLSKKTGHHYRLPTEAEWELAARAGTATRYWWGEAMEPGRANCTGCGGAGDGRQTAPVGSFAANPWGLYDTVGNVWEWTSSAPFDGSLPVSLRVIKGGAWSRDGSAAAVGHRVFNSQGFRSPNLGFRLVREGPPPGGFRVTVSTAARIFVDERPQGEAGPDRPLVLSNLAPGEHRIEAVASGFSPAVASHRVIPNAVTEVSMALESNEEVAWRKCAGAPAMIPCQEYVSAYPEGGHVAAAKEVMERLAWEACAKATDVETCQGYLKDYPGGRHAKDAAGRIDKAAEEAKAAAKAKAEEVRHAIAKGMVGIPGGSFQMGCSRGDGQCVGDERPPHKVKVSGFKLGKTEVTQAQWEEIMGANPSRFKGDERPVENVSWDDAKEFLGRLNAANPGKPYRLPTEAEWEYAARGGNQDAYWWGKDIGNGNANCSGCGSQWDGKETAPVGSFAANPFGLQDTAGNVWEWVQDCWHHDYQGAPANGSGWHKHCQRASRVVRGGSWDSTPRRVRVSNRSGGVPGYRDDLLGLRLAQDL